MSKRPPFVRLKRQLKSIRSTRRARPFKRLMERRGDFWLRRCMSGFPPRFRSWGFGFGYYRNGYF
ncbi:hypothetical protein [Novosphingobium clariflavum]|uniref:Uncharacterized protein n=1 Tax=Novosphingobium clariflavum TaxID=2029884 RepID=A0ABV6S1S9_9SPHN|nr:hypothetical protein [Novosphingobium clariflavum]